jgi:UDP-N-acetylglucosamine--N-acetylmuramyl-(pentapeptide) pyrophosphoryl-undecaprenol N-acetylglucosamine transferase
MTIVLSGGGSGGHITPILAVAHELKQLQPDVRLGYIGQHGDSLGDIVQGNPDIDDCYAVSAGKLRRYHGEGLRQLLDVKTVALNIRDAFRTLRGCYQSYRLLRRLRPDGIFIKGGFVGVPVGLAAARLHIPYVTHDSDAIPGLANRLIARWAAVHAVALPAEVYRYPAVKTQTVGVPVHANYQPITEDDRRNLRRDLGLGDYDQVVFVTGGGLGAQRLNMAVDSILKPLMEHYPKLAVVESVGRANESATEDRYRQLLTDEQRQRVIVKGYLLDMHRYSGAADVIITRAGATTLAEFAIQGTACIVVPNPVLTSGHQLKNALYLADRGAILTVPEEHLATELLPAVRTLLDNPAKREELRKNLAQVAVPDAAKRLAVILLKQAS